MPIWDPFHVEKRHREVRKFIDDGVEGYAQSDVSGTMVSLHLDDGFQLELYHAPMDGFRSRDIVQEMIVDVASNEGRATDRTFRRSFAEWMVDDRRAFPRAVWPKKHAEADRIEVLLHDRPKLFV